MPRPALLKFRNLLLQISALPLIAAGPAWSQLPEAHEFINTDEQKIHKPPQPGTDSCGINLEEGDLYLHCVFFQQGIPRRESARLTYTGDIKSWGITPDAALLASVRGSGDDERTLQLIDLRTGRTTRSESTDRRSRVEPTCGTVVMRMFLVSGKESGYKFKDVAANREISVPPFTLDLRCSDDRRYMLRLSDEGELYLDSTVPVLLAKDIREFNISPDGHYIAYGGGDYICAGTREEVEKAKASCLGMTWTAGPMIILNDGSVLFTEQTAQGCTFKVSGKELSDPCPAIFGWEPGDLNDQLLSFNNSDPHVISAKMGLAIMRAHTDWKGGPD
jgi:hypothetical protein